MIKCRCHHRGTCDMTQMLCQPVSLHMTCSVNRNRSVWCRSSLRAAVSHIARSRWRNGRVGEQTMFVWRCNNYRSVFRSFFLPSLPLFPSPLLVQTDCCSTLCALFEGCRLANRMTPHLYPKWVMIHLFTHLFMYIQHQKMQIRTCTAMKSIFFNFVLI